MPYRYAILGAGRQGVSAAYDLARFGDAEEIHLYDLSWSAASKGAEKINHLAGRDIAKGLFLDVRDPAELAKAFKGIHSVLSAVPYLYNLTLTEVAIDTGTNFCDLGGHTATAREILMLGEDARDKGITIVPDCGMAPGLNINMAELAMSYIEEPRELFIWDGGLPQNPKPPWNYTALFHINGLTNEYHADACFLRDGKITNVPCLTEVEALTFDPPLGTLEAAVTSGGLSTIPWALQGKLEKLENKTLRYPGHWQTFEAYKRLGLFEMETVDVNGTKVVPREFFHTLLEPKISVTEVRDISVIRTKCVGKNGGRETAATVELVDTYCDHTGFTAMEKLTGWHISIVAQRAARGLLPKGPLTVDAVMDGKTLEEECARRGWQLKKTLPQ